MKINGRMRMSMGLSQRQIQKPRREGHFQRLEGYRGVRMNRDLSQRTFNIFLGDSVSCNAIWFERISDARDFIDVHYNLFKLALDAYWVAEGYVNIVPRTTCRVCKENIVDGVLGACDPYIGILKVDAQIKGKRYQYRKKRWGVSL